MSQYNQQQQKVDHQDNVNVNGDVIFQSSGRTGVAILCRKWSDGQFMLSFTHPFCLINDAEEVQLKWDYLAFIHLEPSYKHSLLIYFGYFGRACEAKVEVKLEVGEIRRYVYKNALMAFNNGTIKRVT
jgi:hypothetical protein